MSHVVIIGNGISGITAARHIRKNGGTDRITVISGETDYFFSRTALMYIYMGHMKFEHTQPYEKGFWKKNKIDLVRKWVEKVDCKTKQLHYSDGGSIQYDKLVLATGSKPNMMGWPGGNLNGVQGLFSFQDLEKMEKNTKGIKRAVIVGGGLIGVEMAEMLLTRGIEVTFMVRELKFWGNVLPQEEAEMVGKHMMKDHHVDLRYQTELKEILDDGSGNVKGIRTSKDEVIDCQFVGIAIGVSANIEFLKSSDIELNRGILVNRFLETSQPDVYAIGDCAEFREPTRGRRPLEQVWYTGRMMGEAVARTTLGNRTEYKPNVWFNSAKLFDIEYQTYGFVRSTPVEEETTFYWEHPTENLSMRLVYDKADRHILGVNVFGIRIRHELFHNWISAKKHVEFVLEHLKDANFDPEFYTQYESDILEKYNQENGTSLKSKKKSWRRILDFRKQNWIS